MDSTNRNEAITEAVPKALAVHLKKVVPGLLAAYDEFPSNNLSILLPSISIFASTNVKFTPGLPYALELPTDLAEDVHTSRIQYVVGDYDFKLQLDIWAKNKEERDDIFDALFNALNPDINPMGLVLELTEYFGVLCDYVYVGHTMQDSAERSDRDEWRISLSLLVTCKAIRERTEFIMLFKNLKSKFLFCLWNIKMNRISI